MNALLDRLNGILDRAQDSYHAKLVAKHDFAWQKDMPDDEAMAVLAQNKYRLVIIPKKKYVNIDRADVRGHGCSALFMVENATGNIYGVKAYGVVHRGHCYGTVDAPDVRKMALKAAVLCDREVEAELQKHAEDHLADLACPGWRDR